MSAGRESSSVGGRLEPNYLDQLSLGSRSLGDYLSNDCRDAIAHIRRKPGKRTLNLDRHEERMRLAMSLRIVKAFAEYYIRERLGLKDHVYLVRLKRRGFPIFADSQTTCYTSDLASLR